jgi:hypothetical protein
MANVKAVASGNWSNTATWDGGVLPTSADDVYANNFIVDCDVNFTVLTLRNTSATGITAGGRFNFNTSGVTGTLTASPQVIFSSVQLITITATSGSVTLTCSSEISTSATGAQVISHSGNCDFYISATNLNGVSSSTLINKSSTGTIYVTGNLLGGSANRTALNNTAGNIVVVGNVISGWNSGGSPWGGSGIVSTSGTITVTGDVLGQIINTGNVSTAGIYVNGATSINITGNVKGGNGVSYGISLNTAVTSVDIVGDVEGINTVALLSSSANQVTIAGTIKAGVTPAIQMTSTTSTLFHSGSYINTNGRMALYLQGLLYNNSSVASSWTVQNSLLVSRTMSTNNALPSISDVRNGITYGAGLSLTGTLAVPTADNVRKGVPIDDTVGTADLTAEDFLTAIEESTLDIAERLRNVATVQTTGDQITGLS